MSKKPIYDEYDPWTTYDPAPLTVVRRTPKRTRNHKPTLASIAKQAAKAGIGVARYEVDATGKIIVVPGKPTSPEFRSEEDADLIDPRWN
jgi:hypothetical protein